jgi:antitoxin MazE
MQITIRNIGNSKGVVLPKPLLAQAGLDDQSIADLSFENGALVLRKPATSVRVGWAAAAQALASQSSETLLMEEFGNLDDEALVW